MSRELHPASKTIHVDPSGYLSTQTIVALCTPTGGALAIVRVSGSDCEKIFHSLISNSDPSLWSQSNERMARRIKLYDANQKLIDDAVAVIYKNPKSFTGEDIVEFFLHGSPLIAQKLIDSVIASGARMALPGEFSFRAVKNGKMLLSQAEAVKDLIAAENDFALDLALEKLSGSQHVLVDQLRNDLLQLVTLAEVGIDFSDQDIDEVSLPRLKVRSLQIQSLLEQLKGSFDRGRRINEGVLVSIFGLPNAGKSSFFNALLGEDRSIVSNIAGTTRDVVRERINLRGKNGQSSFRIADTAGLRKSSDQIETIGIERSIRSAQESDLVLIVIDGLKPSILELEGYLKLLNQTHHHWIGVITKQDQMNSDVALQIKDEVRSVFKKLKIEDDVKMHLVSSLTLFGINDVAQSMTGFSETLIQRKTGEVVLTKVEHVHAVERSLECLSRAQSSSDIVLFATDVRHAMGALGSLLGETLPDDVLSKIFSDFCIGK